MPQTQQDKGFVAHVYEEDYREIQNLVQLYPNIETGGDLFGLWKDEHTVVIQHFIGPGKDCRRTTSSFHQDVDYLHKVGSLITTEEGLCNVGEWHSHHQIGMPEPSGADRRTVFSNMPHLGLERFVLFIATIESKGWSGKKRSLDVKLEQIKLRPFLFIDSTHDVIQGKIKVIPGKNPHHVNSKVEKQIELGAETTPPLHSKRKVSSSSEENSVVSEKTREGKGRGKAVKEQAKRGDSVTLQQQARGLHEKPVVTDKAFQRSHETTADESSPHGLKSDDGLGGKPRDDRIQRQEDQYTTSEKERKETQKRYPVNNENQSPNTGSGTSRGSPPPQTPSGGTQRNVSTSLFSPQGAGNTEGNVSYVTSSPLWRNWNDSQQLVATQGMGRGGQGKNSKTTSAAMSQPTSFPPSQPFDTAEYQCDGVHVPHSGYPPYSQSSQFTHVTPNQGGPSHSQHQQRYAQQRNQASTSGQASMPSPCRSPSNQPGVKHNPRSVPIGPITAKGSF